jgi:hypothetical protein
MVTLMVWAHVALFVILLSIKERKKRWSLLSSDYSLMFSCLIFLQALNNLLDASIRLAICVWILFLAYKISLKLKKISVKLKSVGRAVVDQDSTNSSSQS